MVKKPKDAEEAVFKEIKAFKALASPTQTFRLPEGADKKQFYDGYFLTDDKEYIDFLEGNPACESMKIELVPEMVLHVFGFYDSLKKV